MVNAALLLEMLLAVTEIWVNPIVAVSPMSRLIVIAFVEA